MTTDEALAELRRMNLEHEGVYSLVPNCYTAEDYFYDIIDTLRHDSKADDTYAVMVVSTGKTPAEAIEALVKHLEGGE